MPLKRRQCKETCYRCRRRCSHLANHPHATHGCSDHVSLARRVDREIMFECGVTKKGASTFFVVYRSLEVVFRKTGTSDDAWDLSGLVASLSRQMAADRSEVLRKFDEDDERDRNLARGR